MFEFERGLIGDAKVKLDALRDYGFDSEGCYRKPIRDGAFTLSVHVEPSGEMESDLIDNETGDPYNLYKLPSAHGEYLTSLRDEIKAVIKDIKAHCYVVGVHVDGDFFFLRDYCRDSYAEELEYLWGDEENAILRRKDNRKWYAVVMRVPYVKMGIDREGKCTALALRGDPSEVDMNVLFPGYHLNKKYWVCMILDGRCPREDIVRRLETSRELALQKGKK